MPYPQEIVRRSREILEQRREKAVADTVERRLAVSRRAPRALEIEREIATTSARLAAAVLSGEKVQEQVQKIRAFNLEKQQQLSDLLCEAGFAPDVLEPHYFCPVCQDTGNNQGRLCSCVVQLEKELMYERLGAQATVEHCGFDRFDLRYYSEQPTGSPAVSPRAIMSRTLSTCVKYAQDFSLSSPSLLLMGKPGLGKTHLSLSIAYTVIEGGYDVLYLPFHTLLARLETARFSKGSAEYQDYLDPVLSCELLVLDDLGSEFTTAFSTSVLYDLINTRQLRGLPTIINTNLTEGEISGRYGERLHSRLLGGFRVIPFMGEDVRLQKMYSK
ncbi:MAG: ATP-binding protein [Oscillospiraceae bacterium]|nr:MAG: ATP-binding protein [Oscillospiraceae bacterium]